MTVETPVAGPAGYANSGYVQSLAEFGTPLALSRSGGWLLSVAFRDSGYRDAFGPYPLFAVEHPASLAEDIAGLKEDLVSIYAVSDPLREDQIAHFEKAFDFVRPYKSHFVVDLDVGFDRYLGRHHRRFVRQAFRKLEVERAADPAAHVAEWCGLYEELCVRREIVGLRRFSAAAFTAQLSVPGCHYFRALRNGTAVGGLVCYLDRDRAYGHLTSSTALGRDLFAPYGLIWTAIEFFRGKARLFDLGGVPGGMNATADGLASFKSGWSTTLREARFCGRILNRAVYDKLSLAHAGGGSGHFPAYRAGILGTN